jgi:hypothetical protein
MVITFASLSSGRPACTRSESKAGLEFQAGLEIDKIRVTGATVDCLALGDVIPAKEMAVAGFQLREARDGVAGNEADLRADERIEAWIDAVTSGATRRA